MDKSEAGLNPRRIALHNSMKLLLSTTLFLLHTFFCISAFAEKADKDKPISLSSEKASFDDVRQIYHLEVDVLLIKGTLIIRGESADVKIDPEGYQLATIKAKPGSLASLKQKRDTGYDEYVEGFAEWIEYDAKLETATLVGKAHMNKLAGTKISDRINGDRIQYDSSNEKYQALSSASVKSTLSSRRKDQSGNIKK
jgi:lipopolysaccharide export system protein LptA